MTPLLRDAPFVPEPQMVFWVETAILPPGDAEDCRPVVVLASPETPAGTVTVVVRSTTDAFGVEHPAGGVLGFTAPGRFSRRYPVQCQLWTLGNVTPVGPLDAGTFAEVVTRFGP
jgi:hypothetical protein